MGLREQLLKAGLVSKKQAQKADATARKTEHQVHKNVQTAKELQSQKEAEEKAVQLERDRKREEDRLRNLEIEAQRLEREKTHRIRQLINSNDLQERSAEERYYFTAKGHTMRSLLVTPFQREMIARGKIAIVATDDSDDREYVLVPTPTARTILQITPNRFALLHKAIEDWQDIAEIVEKEYWQTAEDSPQNQ
jgi:uncharacterized protein YaiL (DUF2058 family)